MSDLLAHAWSYAELGLEIFPVHSASKRPMAAEVPGAPSQAWATTNLDELEEWWGRWPDALIGHRISPDQVLLDIDPRHGGLGTWRAIRAELNGDFPLTRTHRSGRGDGGGHIWFKRPGPDLTITELDRWAKARDLGQELEGGRWTAGIDLLRHEHRYTILPPSLHPDSHKPYEWAKGKSIIIDPAEMPGWLAALITKRAEATTPAETVWLQSDSIADWYSATHKLAPILTRAGWTLRAGSGDDDGSEWQHPKATTAVSATVRHGCLFVYSTNTGFEPTEPGDPRGYTPFNVYATLEHGGDLRAAGRAAREQKRATEPAGVIPTLTPDRTNGATRSTSTPEPPQGQETGLERVDLEHLEAFWGQLPILGRIRDFARARRCSPWAMLGVVLARVSAAVPPFVVLPPLVGSHMSLNFYVTLVGASGGGKDAAIGAAVDALPFAPSNFSESANPRFAEIGLGSGEGILDQYVEWIPPNKAEHEPGFFKLITRSVLFTNPEIETVSALQGRSSSTLMPMLRDAWMGSRLGFAYRQHQGKRATLDAHAYRLCLVLGCQPTSAGVLLDGSNVGTPQRFVWLPVHDPMAPDEAPEPPEPVEWHLPSWPTSVDGKATLELCDEAMDQIIKARVERLRGAESAESPSGHALACQEKVAALLAILDGKSTVTLPYWSMAGIVATVSTRTRESAEAAVGYEARRRNTAQGNAEAQRKAIVRSTDEETALAKCCQRIKLVLGRRPEGTATWAQLYKETGGRHREFLAEALDLLGQAGEVAEEEREHRGGVGKAYKLLAKG